MTESAARDEALRKATAFHRVGNLVEAAGVCARILREWPDDFDALHLAGILEAQQSRFGPALALLDHALRVRPSSADALANRANVLNGMGRFEEARASAERAVALSAQHVEAHYNLGLAQHSLGRQADALASYDKALALRPDLVPALINRGAALQDLRRPAEALASFDRALRVHPRNVEALYNRGVVLQQLQRYGEALACHEQALALRPAFAQAHNNRGLNFYMQGRFHEAKESCDHALALQPAFAEALFNRAAALSSLRQHEAAAADFARALALSPDLPYARGALLHSRMHACDWASFDEDVAGVLAGVRAGRRVAEPFALLAVCDSPHDQRRCSEIFVADRFAAATKVFTGERRTSGRIVVAYLSADFHDHATAHLMAGLFERHDRQRFATIGVSFGPDRADAMRTRLVGAFDRFLDVRAMTDAEVAGRLEALGAHIAVDLKGYTDHARTGILALRPAPIQVSYLGYPGTMSAPFIDYLIADEVVIPASHERAYREAIVRMPGCYQVNDSARQPGPATTRAEQHLPEHAVVLCAFNPLYKITPAVFSVWMRLLRAVEGSVLWLLDGGEVAQKNLRSEAQRHGIEPDRLRFAPRLPHEQHLARKQLADLFLDTFPCNAHTTASDALRAGLPIVTCRGEAFAGRVAASLLHAIGAPELVCATLERYEALARELAADTGRRLALRRRIEMRREHAALFDPDRFRRHLEAAYEAMWLRRQRGEPPAPIAVSPVA